MTLPVRLTESGLTKERQNKLKDSHSFGIDDPEYEVFKKGSTFYISKRSDCCGPPPTTPKQIVEDEPKVRRAVSKEFPGTQPSGRAKNQVAISGQEILEQYADLKKMLLDEKRKRQKIKTKVNSIHADIYKESAVDRKSVEADPKIDEDPDQEITPTFVLKNRRR